MCHHPFVGYAAATEDTDALVAGAPRVLRNFVAQAAKKGVGQSPKEIVVRGGKIVTPKNVLQVVELRLSEALRGLNVTLDQLADLSVLMGCGK